MTNRIPVSQIHNNWYDGQRVDQTDVIVEQNRNVKKDASIVQNHFGSGVLPISANQKILFDSDDLYPDQVALIASNDFDGTGLRPLAQPTDIVLGNQLEIELKDSDIILNGTSTVNGRLSSKVLIIGLDFQGNLQYDSLYFYRKEKQVTKKHYTNILSVFFNDFYGNNNCSRKLGGRFIISESKSFQLSRDAKMIAQDIEPNLFFRDFKVSNVSISGSTTITLAQTIQAGIGTGYSIDALDINTTVKRNVEIPAGDVTTKLAEKFLAKTNNIQKISLLLGVRRDDTATIDNIFNWSGELIVNVFELQTSTQCPTSLVPELAIEFDPNPEPITQFSLDQSDLRDQGYILTDVLQPIDFVFNNSILGNTANPKIIPGKYYVISINRAGDSSTGTLFTGIGNSRSTDDRFSIFSGSWVDVPEEDMWYQVWSDTAKVSDGMGYDAGNGIDIAKTEVNELGAVVDYSFDQNAFIDSGQNTLNTAIIEAVLTQSTPEQDERTGNPVYARQKFEPSFSFVTNTTLATLRESSEPLIIGCARDLNAKSNNIITGIQVYPGLAKGNIFRIVNPDPDIISQQLIGSKIITSDDCSSIDYKIFKTRLCTDGYGDVNGDGTIDASDVLRATDLLNQSLELASTQALIRDGYIDTLEILRADVDGDGYITNSDINLISDYVNRNINSFPVGSSFTHIEIEVQNNTGRFDGYYDCGNLIRIDGYNGNAVEASTLTASELLYYGYNSVPNISVDNPIFDTVPWVPVQYIINPFPFWQDYLLQFSSAARQVPCVFSDSVSTNYLFDNAGNCLESETSTCQEIAEMEGSCDPGVNDFYVPNNLIIDKGQILNNKGEYFKQDLEIYTVTIELPSEEEFEHAILNIFNSFVLNDGDGFTSAGYPAAKFADCSFVTSAALIKNQIRFGVSIQSVYPSFDGYDSVDGYGIVIDDIIAIHMDQSTGILTLSAKDIDHSSVYSELRTKILITIYLKKAGWINNPLVISASEAIGLFI